MPANLLGERFAVMSFGESHGKCVGVVIDGCPAGLPIKLEDIQREVDLRRPTSIISTTRAEPDQVDILSGVFNNRTTGAPICLVIWNRDIDSKPYEEIKDTPRPGHADYPARVKYRGFEDYRGGGRFSARVTAGFVMAGAVAKMLLRRCIGVRIVAYTKEIGGIRASEMPLDEIEKRRYLNEVRCPDEEAASLMKEKILEARKQEDSLGGVVECIVDGLKTGIGEPIFSSLDSEISKAIFSIPAVKGVEFGLGFQAARVRGSEDNDEYAIKDGKIIALTNRAGGVLGGLSTGMPLIFRAAFKPPSSIPKKQKTVDLKSMREVELVVKGRHDPCVVPRAVPIVEAVTAIVLADLALRGGYIPPILDG
ncbi:MAG: chorismate synthase [Nitrososphaerales archaeon]